MEQDKHPEHLIYITLWCNTAEIFEKEKEIIQILLEADFDMKQKKLEGRRAMQSKGIHPYHMASCQAVNLERLAGGGSSLSGEGLGIDPPMGSNCIVLHLVCIFLYHYYYFPSFGVLLTLFS